LQTNEERFCMSLSRWQEEAAVERQVDAQALEENVAEEVGILKQLVANGFTRIEPLLKQFFVKGAAWRLWLAVGAMHVAHVRIVRREANLRLRKDGLKLNEGAENARANGIVVAVVECTVDLADDHDDCLED